MMKPVFRSLRRQPGFASIAILTLALGIGVNVAIFSAIEALVINPLPYPDAKRLVAVYEDAAWIGYAKNTPAPANYVDWKRQAKTAPGPFARNEAGGNRGGRRHWRGGAGRALAAGVPL
jgi:hypothetical protein